MDIKRYLAGLTAAGCILLGCDGLAAGNRPPEIKGFFNPAYLEDKTAARYLQKISILKGNPITTKLLMVEDKDGDTTDSSLDSIVKTVQLKDKSVDIPAKVKKDGHFIYISDPGRYKLVFSASDGKAVSKKTIDVLVQSPDKVLTKSEKAMYEAIGGDMMIHLKELGSYSSFTFTELAGLLGAESDFKNSAVSEKEAKTWAQITEVGRQGLEETYRKNRKLIDTALDLEKVESLQIGKDYIGLEAIDLYSLGFTLEKFKEAKNRYRPKLSRSELLHVVVPQYLKIRELFPDGKVDRDKLLKDPKYSSKAMAAILEKDYIQLSAMQIYKEEIKVKGKKETVYGWLYRPRSHFIKHPETRAFSKADVISAYNAGLPSMVRKKMEIVKSGRYDPMRLAVAETKGHRLRHKGYTGKLEELENKLEQHCYYHSLIRHSFD